MTTPRPPAARLTRRQLLAGMAAAGGAALLAACGRGSPEDRLEARAAQALGRDDGELAILVASIEALTGPGRRLQFGLLDPQRANVADADVRAFVYRDGDLVQGPVTPTYHDEGLEPRGIYVFRSDLPEPGVHDLVVVTADGQRAGSRALQVYSPAESPVRQQVGDPIPPLATATVADPGDLAELCTREPDCEMHAVSLDDALAAGRPVVLTIATPKWCQTAICGPVVDVVEGVRRESDRDDIQWIHVEVFKDAGNTPVDPVVELGLPSEPWIYLVGADGRLADKFDGPVPADLLRTAVADL